MNVISHNKIQYVQIYITEVVNHFLSDTSYIILAAVKWNMAGMQNNISR